jgi:hypothetical protein
MLTSIRAGQPHNIDAIALPPGGHPNKIVVADDTRFVEHPGNAGRPHAAAAHQPQHQPATRRAKKASPRTPQTGNARPRTTPPTCHLSPALGRSRSSR